MKTWRVQIARIETHSVSNLYYFITNELIFLLSRAVVNKRNVINVSKQIKFYVSSDKAVRWNFTVSFELTIGKREKGKSRCKI